MERTKYIEFHNGGVDGAWQIDLSQLSQDAIYDIEETIVKIVKDHRKVAEIDDAALAEHGRWTAQS